MATFGLVMPTLNAVADIRSSVAGILSQTARTEHILFIDSSSNDGTPEYLKDNGFRVVSIPRSEFDHGGTRQLATRLLPEVDIYVFVTQDAYLNADAVELLLSPFREASVGAAFGRQVPHARARTIGAHARAYNYPADGGRRTRRDIARMGLKAAFISNSFAAYRRSALDAVGGFPEKVIFGEDQVVGARMILAGYEIAYASSAIAHHSHDYSFTEEFRRYFDIGVLHAREPWLLESFGSPENEGIRFLLSEVRYLLANQPAVIPEALTRTVLKYFAYRLGRVERALPLATKRRVSLNRKYWDTLGFKG